MSHFPTAASSYCGVVHGDYLDDRVNPARTDFDIEPRADGELPLLLDDDLPLDDIREGALHFVREDLAPFLTDIRKAKEEAILAYIQDEAPHYRVLLPQTQELVEAVKPNASKLEIDLALHEVLYLKEVELKKLGAKVMLEADHIDDYDAYVAEMQTFLEGENAILGRAALGKYVAHRKIIINFLEKALSKVPDDEKYPLEEAVHKLVFPLRSSSEDILYSQQNLWLLDERLSYHTFINSDQQLRSSKAISSASRKRPDIALFDTRFVFAEGDRPISSIVLIEFKRPMRGDFTKDDPVEQILGVVKNIRQGTFLEQHGRPLSVNNNDVPIFAYVVCDLTPKLRERMTDHDFFQHPDGEGYFDFRTGYRCYIEVISYNKLLGDAQKRNRVLFQRLFGTD